VSAYQSTSEKFEYLNQYIYQKRIKSDKKLTVTVWADKSRKKNTPLYFCISSFSRNYFTRREVSFLRKRITG